MKTDQIVAKLAELETQLAANHELIRDLQKTVGELEEKVKKSTDRRGPKSDREMTDDDAYNVMFGDHEKSSHKDAAEKLGLSYAQVYSARKGFTFKHIAKAGRKPVETPQA